MANVEMKLEVDMRGMRAAMDAVMKVRDLPAEVQKDYFEALGRVAIHYMRAMGGGTGAEMLKLKPTTQLTGPKERARVERKRAEQGYDPEPPRCGTCLFFTLGTWSQRAIEAKKGRGIEHLQRCTFGNFHTTTRAVCDEWRNKDGERIAEGGSEPCEKVEN